MKETTLERRLAFLAWLFTAMAALPGSCVVQANRIPVNSSVISISPPPALSTCYYSVAGSDGQHYNASSISSTLILPTAAVALPGALVLVTQDSDTRSFVLPRLCSASFCRRETFQILDCRPYPSNALSCCQFTGNSLAVLGY